MASMAIWRLTIVNRKNLRVWQLKTQGHLKKIRLENRNSMHTFVGGQKH
jgi:hypothetical protein